MHFRFILATSILSCATQSAVAALPKGYVDQVVREGGQWRIKGWACQPGLGQAVQVQLYINGQANGAAAFTTQLAEAAVHAECGTSPSSDIPYRYSLAFAGSGLSGQQVRVDAIGPGGNGTLAGSGEFRLPQSNVTPDAVFSAATRILLVVAHQGDEILFSPFVKTYCWIVGKTCKFVTATNDPVRVYEWPESLLRFPALGDLGGFSSGHGSEAPSAIRQQWNAEAAAAGLITLNNVVAREIDKFIPDVIVTFDPRHGTSCHSEHRATGDAVRLGVSAYAGPNFPDKTKLFFLTTRQINWTTDFGALYVGLLPIAPRQYECHLQRLRLGEPVCVRMELCQAVDGGVPVSVHAGSSKQHDEYSPIGAHHGPSTGY